MRFLSLGTVLFVCTMAASTAGQELRWSGPSWSATNAYEPNCVTHELPSLFGGSTSHRQTEQACKVCEMPGHSGGRNFCTKPGRTEPGWTGRVLKVGADKEMSDATPIELRPYRPLHVYGNTTRRQYYRGNPLPMPYDLSDAIYAFFYVR
jgi:hypothetical protein